MPTIRVALAGDAILTRDLRAEADPELTAVTEVLRDSDCAIGNLELPLHDFRSPAAVAPGGLWLGADPARAHDLAWFGITAVSRANNHAMDYGAAAMRQTDRALLDAGIAHAGTGEDLSAARAPTLITTAAGRVALVSATATFPLGHLAGDPRPPIPGRPGVSPLRRTGDRLVDRAEALIRRGLPIPELRRSPGEQPAWLVDPTEDLSPVCPPDAAAVLAAVRQAREQADAVVVALHSHDQGATRRDQSRALIAFARECIDAGADIVAGHGSHVVRGVERYRGRHILYDLGSLFFQPDTVPYLPADAYRLHGLGADATVADVFAARWGDGRRGLAGMPTTWQGLIAVVTLDGAHSEVELIPLDLRKAAGPGLRGTPRLV